MGHHSIEANLENGSHDESANWNVVVKRNTKSKETCLMLIISCFLAKKKNSYSSGSLFFSSPFYLIGAVCQANAIVG